VPKDGNSVSAASATRNLMREFLRTLLCRLGYHSHRYRETERQGETLLVVRCSCGEEPYDSRGG